MFESRCANPGSQEEPLFQRKDFTYEAEHDRYQCPADAKQMAESSSPREVAA